MEIAQLITGDYCLRCKGCCRFRENNSAWVPKLLEEEKTRISNINLRAVPGEDGFVCEYLNSNDNKCGIYLFRPFECRLYPFLINRTKKGVFLAVDLNCPFIKENMRSEAVLGYIEDLIKSLQSGGFVQVLKKNPHIIQEYEGVFDLRLISA